jgi:hypothetical protein
MKDFRLAHTRSRFKTPAIIAKGDYIREVNEKGHGVFISISPSYRNVTGLLKRAAQGK